MFDSLNLIPSKIFIRQFLQAIEVGEHQNWDADARPAESGGFWGITSDVLYTSDLPGLIDPREIALGGGYQPDHSDRGDLPRGLSGSGRCVSRWVGVQRRFCAGGAVHRGGDLQPC